MKKLLISLALFGASLPIFSVNPTQWVIKQNPVDGVSGFPMTASGRQIFADYNNDGIVDYFIIAGQGDAVIGMFKGNADGTYTDVTANSADLFPKSWSSALFIDIDNDGNLDLLTIGRDGGEPFTDIFMNNGAPDYTFRMDMDIAASLPGLFTESADNGSKLLVGFDYNNDGWTDILINGNANGTWEEPDGNGQGRVAAIMKNNKGKLELVKNPVDGNTNFLGVNGGSVDVADFNRDGWMDIIVTGYEDNLKTLTRLYKNNGNGTFAEIKGVNFVGHQQGETAFIDVNNDGYADIIEIGRDVNNGWATFGKLYINNKNETFTRIEEDVTNLFGGGCALAIGDVNNDGWTDFLMSGWNTNTTFMYNNGNNVFTKVDIDPIAARCRGGAVTFADVNKDGFLDMGIFGYRDGGGADGDNLGTWPDYILLNKGGDGIAANVAPSAPSNVVVTYNTAKKCYELTWSKSSDDTTPADAIRYNVYVKTADGKINTLLPADIKTGAIKMFGTQYPLLPQNKYEMYMDQMAGVEFGVQAIDNGWMSSSFVKAGTSGLNNVLDQSSYEVLVSNQIVSVSNLSEKSAKVRLIAVDGSVIAEQTCAAAQTITMSPIKGAYLVEITIDNKCAFSKVLVY